MNLIKLHCSWCKKIIFRDRRRVNEAKKLDWKTYCSRACQSAALNKRILLKCVNKNCLKDFLRSAKEIKKSKNHFCSQSCAAIVNNSLSPKRKKKLIKNFCKNCGSPFFRKGLFCSTKCKQNNGFISKEKIVERIKDFYHKYDRIPFKQEFKHYNTARDRFGSWNNAIKVAGFHPNPVMFSKKHIANDGHKCDSLTEKIIDDWFTARGIKHKRSVSYPNGSKLLCDFLVKSYYIEFFGLENEHKRYTELVKIKRQIAKDSGIKLIEIKPSDIFPKNKLEEKFSFLLSKKNKT